MATLPVTRRIADRLKAFVGQFNEAQGPPVAKMYSTGPAWRFPVEDMNAVQVGKSVRLASGLNAMLSLYDQGFVMESLALIRPHLDFVDDILLMRAGPSVASDGTKAARQVRDAFFHQLAPDGATLPAPLPFPSRREIQKVILQSRILQYERLRDFGSDAVPQVALPEDGIAALEQMSSSRERVGHFANDVVHQGYDYIMSMYDPSTGQFELEGTRSETLLRMCRLQIAAAANYFLIGFGVMAAHRGMRDVVEEIKGFHETLAASGELSNHRDD